MTKIAPTITRLLFMQLFMILLIVSIPVVSAEIVSVQINGNDGIAGFVRRSDQLSVQATIAVAPGILAQDIYPRMRIGTQNPSLFDTCTDAAQGVVLCNYARSFDWGGLTIFNMTVNMLDAGGNVALTRRTAFYVDVLPPQLQSVVPTQSGNTVNVSFRAIDQTYPGSSVCVGLQSARAQVRVDGVQGPFVDVSLGGCDMTGSAVVPLPSGVVATSGTVLLSVSDRFNNTYNASYPIVLDTQGPQIHSIALRTADGRVLRYVGSSQEVVRLVFNASDDRRISRSFVELNGQQSSPVCSVTSTTASRVFYSCMTGEMVVNDPSSFSGSVEVADDGGNIAVQQFSFQVERDATAPVFRNARGGVMVNGTLTVGPDAPFVVDVDETQSGMASGQVYAQTAVGVWVRASQCIQQGSAWTCSFPLTGLSHGQNVTYSAVRGQDDAGNLFASGFDPFTATVDKRAPEVVADDGVVLYSLINALPVRNLVGLGGELQGTINLTAMSDISDVSGTVNVSDLLGPQPEVPLACLNGVCRFSARVGSQARQGTVSVLLRDAVGNTATFSQLVAVVEIAPNGDFNPVVVQSVVNPSVLDRSVGRLINQIAYADVTFSFFGGDPRNIQFDSCVSAPNRTQAGISDIAFFQRIDEVNIPDPLTLHRKLRLTLKTAELDINELNIVCQYKVAYINHAGQLVTDLVIRVPLQFEFANVVGGLPENYQKKLDDAIKDANDGILNKIAKLEKYVAIARNICRIWEMIKSFLVSLQGVLEFLDINARMIESATVFLGGSPAAPVKATGEGVCTTQESINKATGSDSGLGLGKIVGYFCNFVTCRFSLTSWLAGQTNFFSEEQAEAFGSGNIVGLLNVGGSDTSGSGGTSTGLGVFDETETSYVDDEGIERERTFVTLWNSGVDAMAANTEDSLVLSTLNLCLPGIIKNLQEYRQIQCRYAVCLRDEVPSGVPIEACESEKGYATCKYVMGEIFMLIPFTALFDMYMNKIKQILSDPVAMIGALWGGLCAASCPGGWLAPYVGESFHRACAYERLFRDLGNIVRIVSDIFRGDAFRLRGYKDACNELNN